MIDKLLLTTENKITFGKYKGYTIEYVLYENPEYLVWASENVEFFKLEPKVLARAKESSIERDKTYRKYRANLHNFLAFEVPYYERYGDEG